MTVGTAPSDGRNGGWVGNGPAVVALGGGHGLAASLSALRGVTDRLTAIVTVADDGGSSGGLRRELGALPPGDLRMALAALAGDDDWGRQWAALLQHRFPGSGKLAGHAVGNLVLTGLTDMLAGDAVAALDLTARLLGARGRVLPLSGTPLDILADVAELDPTDPAAVTLVRGQVAVAITTGRVLRVRLEPANPAACPQAVSAIQDADWVVFGPGSWFTSVLPHLLVPELAAALLMTSARRLVVLNLAPQRGETDGFSPERHLEVLTEHAPALTADVVLADVAAVPDPGRLRAAAASLGARLVLAPVAVGDGTARHDPLRLAAAYASIFAASRAAPVPSSRAGNQAGGNPMAMTAGVKDELSRLPVTKPCCRRAEISALLRFAGGLHLVSGRVVVEAELDTGVAARRLRREVGEVYGHSSEVQVLAAAGLRKGSRYVVRVVRDGEGLARRTGLLDGHGRPVRGLPPHVVSGATCDAAAAWRGAFLAHGSLTEPGRSAALEVTCPGPEAALALVGAARRIGVPAKARDVRGVDRVVIRDGDAIGAMLTRLGAHGSVLAWEERRMRREVRATANRLANFDDANLRRSARAAVAAGARVQRSLEILGEDAPEHLLAAGRLRLEHGQASLEELGLLAEPALTKDAIAGRVRRLLALADRRAAELGVPDTEQGLAAEPPT